MKKPIVDQYERMILREVPDSFSAQCLIIRMRIADLKRVISQEITFYDKFCKRIGIEQ